MSLTHQSQLDAMDGISMALDADLRIVQIGEPNWQQLFDVNTPSAQPRDSKWREQECSWPSVDAILRE